MHRDARHRLLRVPRPQLCPSPAGRMCGEVVANHRCGAEVWCGERMRSKVVDMAERVRLV
eukprot:2671373-Prymnesium_polylepis.1